jgi:hypothetical protein
MDPDRRADYDAKLRGSGERSPVPLPASHEVGNGDTPRRRARPDERVPDSLRSLVLSGLETNGPLSPGSDSPKAASRWSKTLLIGGIVASHALILGTFLIWFFGPSTSKPNGSDFVHNGPARTAPAAKPIQAAPAPQALRRADRDEETRLKFAANQPAHFGGTGITESGPADRPNRRDPVPPETDDQPDRRDQAETKPGYAPSGGGVAQQPPATHKSSEFPPAQEDPIALKLRKAKEDYDARLTKLREPILKEMERRRKAAQDSGSLERLVAMDEAIAAFEKTNSIPDRLPAREFRREYPKLLDQMKRAFEDAVQAYTRQGMVAEAKSVANDLADLRQVAWDPRRSPSVDWDQLKVRAQTFIILEHDRGGSFKRDLSANAKVIVAGGKAFVTDLDDGGYALCSHPISGEVPATIDFGDLTDGVNGTLRLWVRNYPRTDGGMVVVKKDGRIFGRTRVVDADGWQEITVPLSRNRVEVEHHAINWGMEFLFFRYEIRRQGGPPRMPEKRKGAIKG